jgi:hypothetical protein
MISENHQFGIKRFEQINNELSKQNGNLKNNRESLKSVNVQIDLIHKELER